MIWSFFDEPPPLVARPAAQERSFPEIAAGVAELRNARSEHERCIAASHALRLLSPDELSAMAGLLIDRLEASMPEEWH